LTVISFILLLLSLAAAGGAFAYKNYLQARIYSPCKTTSQVSPNSDLLGLSGDIEKECGLYASLEEMRRRLDSERLEKIKRLDTKMEMASKVLASHSTLIPLFDLLSTTTLKTIRYTKFSTAAGQVNLSGTASGYEDIAVESNILNAMPEVRNALFSNLDLDQNGRVTFTLNFGVDAGKLRFAPAPAI
jgi:hypothetical protein